MAPPIRRPSRYTEIEHAQDKRATLKRLSVYFIEEKIKLLFMFVVVVIGALSGIFAPSYQSEAVDIITKNNGELLTSIIMMLSLYLLQSLCQLIQGLLGAHLGQNIVKRLREDLFSRIIDLPIKYLDTHSHGDLMSRMTNDIENISINASRALIFLFSGLLSIVGTASIMLWYCWQLALLSFSSVLLTLAVSHFLAAKVLQYSREQQDLMGKLNGNIEEMISGYRTVVAYNHQKISVNNFCSISDKLTEAGIKTEIYSGVTGPLINGISNIVFVIIAAFGGYFAIKGIISIGVISAFIVYVKQFSQPINELGQIYGQLQSAVAGAERVFAIIDRPIEDRAGEDLEKCDETSITLEGVNFSYVSQKQILRNLNLKIEPGQKIALVGSTGSGKTTVANLLLRFYDVDSGRISINSQDLKTISRPSLRKNIAIVLQDTLLFSDTIYNNLLYANKEATPETLSQTLDSSHCREFIERLPLGLQTVLEKGGTNLSHGQRQLLSIARAFIADPKILILDEATSSVDTRTEKNIQSAMQKVMHNRTSIVIAHRLSTIRDADLIVVLDQGQVVEQGHHLQLLEQKGRYYQLYMSQFAGFET